MQKEILSTTNAPAAIGPYSQGIAAGELVFVSGQLPIDPATSLDKVVKTTCFLSDISYFAAFNEAYAEFFPAQGAPARSAVGVAALPKGAKLEIEAIAIK